MKGFIAIALAKVPDFLAQPLKQPLHLALSYDEEIGCLGVSSMIEKMVKHIPRPKAVIVGEPTNMKVVNAHKGICSFHTHVQGFEAHSSNTHLGVNAIETAVRLIGELTTIGDDLKITGDPSGRFVPPHTTVHVGTIKGGTAQNIIPKDCSFSWEYRGLPDQDENLILGRFERFCDEVILPPLTKISDQVGITTISWASVPGLRADDGSNAETLALALTGHNETLAVSYATEAGHFQEAEIPAVICGPGSIEQAHKPDEYCTLDQITECEAFIDSLCTHMTQ
jgi:acetylornithine deacetylase